MLRLPQSVGENLTFLIAETDSQLNLLAGYVLDHQKAMGARILDRAGYSYNLKVRVQNGCWNRQKTQRKSVNRLRLQAIESIAHDLDRITDLARTVVEHLNSLEETRILEPNLFKPIFKHLREGMHLIPETIETGETDGAIQLNRLSEKIEKKYRKVETACIEQVRKSLAHQFTAILLAAHALRQMGQLLLRISQSLLSAILGQAINFDRFYSLKALSHELEQRGQTMEIETLAETRSGSGISAIRPAGSNEVAAIFKEGEKKKVKEERDGFEAWDAIYPGLAPKVLSYKKRGDSAALLIEHLDGLTLEHIVLNENDELLKRALKRLMQTLRTVWQQTQQFEPVSAQFMSQLKRRLPNILALHPELAIPQRNLCGVPVDSLSELIEKTRRRDIAAPFSVYIHGDFNLDNILFDTADNRINFIDLHRSRHMDYVQDISVMMVSCYRLQVLEPPNRNKILGVALEISAFGKRFAKKHGDTTYEFRLAQGLARSLITSTRFILDQTLCQRMILRARFLLERINEATPGREARFRLPMKELFNE